MYILKNLVGKSKGLLLFLLSIATFLTVDSTAIVVYNGYKPVECKVSGEQFFKIGRQDSAIIIVFENDFAKLNNVTFKDSIVSVVFYGTETSVIPKVIIEFQNIRKMMFIHCRFEDMDSTFKTLSMLNKLEELNFSATYLPFIPSSIKRLVSLKSLSLSYMKLYKLPEKGILPEGIESIIFCGSKINCFNFSGLPANLEYLEILNCKVHHFCGNLNGNRLREIRILGFRFTKVKLNSVMTNLLNCKVIESLTIADCNLKSIPKELISLKSLNWIYLGNNRIRELTDDLLELNDSTKLILWWNPVKKISPKLSEWVKKRGIKLEQFSKKPDLFVIEDEFPIQK